MPNIYRRLANIYFQVGVLDDAICYSWLVQATANTIYQAGQHARLLLALNYNEQAAAQLKAAVEANPEVAPAQLYLDYAIALFSSGDTQSSAAAAGQMLSTRGGTAQEKNVARVISLLEVEGEQRESLLAANFDDRSDICDADLSSGQEYWPRVFEEAVQSFLVEVCGEQSEI